MILVRDVPAPQRFVAPRLSGFGDTTAQSTVWPPGLIVSGAALFVAYMVWKYG